MPRPVGSKGEDGRAKKLFVLAELQRFCLVLCLVMGLVFTCFEGGLAAAYSPVVCGPSYQPPKWLPLRCYELTGADVVGAARALDRGIAWWSAPQAAAAALALLLPEGRRRRALAVVALAAAAANYWRYARVLGLARINSAPGDRFLTVETGLTFAATAMTALGLLAFILEEMSWPGPGVQQASAEIALEIGAGNGKEVEV